MSDEWKNAPLVVSNEGPIRPILPTDIDSAWKYAQFVVAGGLAPDSYEKDPQKIVLGIMAGLELGVPPLTALRNIMIVNNRYCVWGDLAIALVQAKGLLHKQEAWYEMEGKVINGPPDATTDSLACVVHLFRKGQEHDPYVGRFSLADAKRANLYPNPKKAPWMQYTARMLFNRARAFAIRDGFADALAGLSIREEIEDLPLEPRVVDQSHVNVLLGPADKLPTEGASGEAVSESPAQEDVP